MERGGGWCGTKGSQLHLLCKPLGVGCSQFPYQTNGHNDFGIPGQLVIRFRVFSTTGSCTRDCGSKGARYTTRYTPVLAGCTSFRFQRRTVWEVTLHLLSEKQQLQQHRPSNGECDI